MRRAWRRETPLTSSEGGTRERTAASRPNVGFIGLGQVGRPLAGRLLEAGYQLRVWNRAATGATALAAEFPDRVAVAQSAGAVASKVERLVLCLLGCHEFHQEFAGGGEDSDQGVSQWRAGT